MAKVNREVGVTTTLKKKIADIAWTRRTTSAALVRTAVEDYAAGKPRGRLRTDEKMDAIKIQVDPEKWAAAQERADKEGLPLSEALRGELDKLEPATT